MTDLPSNEKTSIKFPNGKKLHFSPGVHNELQKAIIEHFLPRFCDGGEILYVADSTDKDKLYKKKKLRELGFPDLDHGMLPDIIAYSRKKDWIYLVEAVHTANPWIQTRKVNLENLLNGKCNSGIIYVSAFLDRGKFRTWVPDLAWETEVWIKEEPDHLIHFNGHKFLGPYKNPS